MRNLQEVRKSLPAAWYYDPSQYARELDAIWYRDWVCVGRLETLASDGEYFVASIGKQKVIVTRVADGQVKAYYNTCRHRGSELCSETTGKFRNGRIICPYHVWTYSLQGKLLATPGRFETDDFKVDDYDLYGVHADTWGGFIFVNLAAEPDTSLAEFLGADAEPVKNWPLADLRSIRQETLPVACNWKIFWENYNECYHCPKVHPELCKVMPDYKKAVFDACDLPGWQPKFEGDKGLGSVGAGAQTWSMDGKISLPLIEGPTEQEIATGVIFGTFLSSMYVVVHPDYVRTVRVVPTGPENTDLVVDWLVSPEAENISDDDIERVCELARLVVQQDGDVCERNQRGLHSRPHQAGMLVPQEYELWRFHEYIREKLARATT
jgi:Rieske 2Fe-2S family protein